MGNTCSKPNDAADGAPAELPPPAVDVESASPVVLRETTKKAKKVVKKLKKKKKKKQKAEEPSPADDALDAVGAPEDEGLCATNSVTEPHDDGDDMAAAGTALEQGEEAIFEPPPLSLDGDGENPLLRPPPHKSSSGSGTMSTASRSKSERSHTEAFHHSRTYSDRGSASGGYGSTGTIPPLEGGELHDHDAGFDGDSTPPLPRLPWKAVDADDSGAWTPLTSPNPHDTRGGLKLPS